MDRQAHSINLQDIEGAIRRGFRLLRFDPKIERRFENDVEADRCKSMIRNNYIGIVIYHCFLYSDYRSIGDVFYLDLFVHFLIMTPLMVIVNLLLGLRPPVWMREGLEVFAIVVLAVTIVAVVAASRLPDRDIVNFSLALVVLFAIIMQRIRFWYVIVCCIAIQTLYGVSVSAMTELSTDRMLMFNTVFLGIVLFSLVGAYNLEHEQRMGYLLRLRDFFRNEQLERASLRDPLTGIANRRALDAALAQLPAGTDRVSPRTTAILLLDIDHFKLFNDTNGHQEGDICLKRVAGLIEGSLRNQDEIAYRYGGEEFLVLLRDTTLDDALAVAERIRSNVEHAQILRDRKAKGVVTVSVGVASGRLGNAAASDALIATADAALYTAKHRGRNRVWLGNGPHPAGPLLATG